MRVVPDWREMNTVLRVIITSSFVGFLLALILVACNDEYYFGKTREELARELFLLDSLLIDIQYQLDSTTIDFERFYIDSQLDTHGYK